jgi:hypothetical protein
LSEGGDRRDLQTNQAEKSPISQGKFLFKIITTIKEHSKIKILVSGDEKSF